MMKYLELCVELRKSQMVREGLYQYRNICQQVNIGSLTGVIRSYLKLAEEKTEKARQESKQVVLNLEDLDCIQTPESVLLSAVSGENTHDRTDFLRLVPWVKFLWESYRLCLDILKNNSKVERLYHGVAQQAFKFCLKYNRKTEMRRLCDNLHTHLDQIPNLYNQSIAIHLDNPETHSMHLETRLVQLDHAISMELWLEAFKAMQDIHALFGSSKTPIHPKVMASYYKKMSTVFWKSEKPIFHACALHQHFHLSKEMRKNLTQVEIQRMSTRVLLATLAIPITPERTDIAFLLGMNDVIVEKQCKLATLLGLKSPPTRQSLINDMVQLDILQYVVPEVKELYNWLEVDFNPLKLSERVMKVLNWVRDQAEKESDLQQYIPHLESNTVLRVLQQVAQIYERINFSRLASLVPFVNAFQLEHCIVDAARHCGLQVRIDHASWSLSFGSQPNSLTIEDAPVGPFLQNQPNKIQNQLADMSESLTKAIQLIQPASILQEREEQKQLAIAAYLENSQKNRQQILASRQNIKERQESLNICQDKEEVREAEMQKERKAEQECRELEVKEREMARVVQHHEHIKKIAVHERLEQLKKTELGAKVFKNMCIEDLEKMDPGTILAKQVKHLEKEKKKHEQHLKLKEKEYDHFVRAKHLEEVPLIKKAYEEQLAKENERVEMEINHKSKLEHEYALKEKRRMSKMMEDKEIVLSKQIAAHSIIYEEKQRLYSERLVVERVKRLEDRKRQRREEKRKAYYRQKEEEANRIREEQLKQEREERERLEQKQREEKERERQENLRKLEEQEKKQRARQQEIQEQEQHREEERRALLKVKPKEPVEKEGGWRSEGTRCGFGNDRSPRRGFNDARRPKHGLDDARGPRHSFDDERGPSRGMDDWRSARRGADDDLGSRRGGNDDKDGRRGMDVWRGARREADDVRGPRRGGNDDRDGRRGMDNWRGARREADDVRGPRRGGNDDRDGRRDMGKGPHRGGDNTKPQKPLDRPDGLREQEKAREDHCRPPYGGPQGGGNGAEGKRSGERFKDQGPVRRAFVYREENAGRREGPDLHCRSRVNADRDVRRDEVDHRDRNKHHDVGHQNIPEKKAGRRHKNVKDEDGWTTVSR
ncbi:eukaryotic translation initiation factor 3 subunit A-like isoform X2 [Gouania willdenowi]|nr:eukaryotic translation initiation factor 3 subunit A-like isoform X2 [Gouania willdenowi]